MCVHRRPDYSVIRTRLDLEHALVACALLVQDYGGEVN